MKTPTEKILISERVKREIERRRRDGESYNDVLERLFGTDRERDLLAGAGFWSEDEAEGFRENRREVKAELKERMPCGMDADQ